MREYREEKYVVMGYSTVASLWRKVYKKTNVDDDISKVIAQCGQPDEVFDAGDGIFFYTWTSHEFKGWLRGGWYTRQLAFSVKDGKILEKDAVNLDMIRF